MATLSARLHGFRPGRDDQEPVTPAVPEPPQETGDVPGPAPQPKPAGHALYNQDGTRADPFTQAWRFTRDTAKATRRRGDEATRSEGNWVGRFLNAQPPSVNGQRDYKANKRWLPPGHEGGLADDIGTAYQNVVGIPVVMAGNAVSFAGKRMWRFTWAMAVWFAVVFPFCKVLLRLPLIVSLLPAALPGVLAYTAISTAAAVLIGRRIARENREAADVAIPEGNN